jgi:aminopeptidase-like protein
VTPGQEQSIASLDVGLRMHQFAERLYPVCRSITGEGVRQTLAAIKERIPIEIHNIPTGTPVFDWSIPKEWNIRDAYIKNAQGDRVVDFNASTLHVLNYSVPIRRKMSLTELRPHLFTLPEHPDWIPYKTSYYAERWGFCLAHNEMLALGEGEYEVCIDSTLKDGSLTYGEFLHPGEVTEEVLISTHVCHPALCNDNLSGIVLVTELAALVAARQNHYSYRFLFIPGTIGSIAWLAQNARTAHQVKFGLVAACVGDRGMPHYKRSRRGNADIDRIVEHILNHTHKPFRILPFEPYGYDERQFCSPGFDLPVGSLTRTPHDQFAQYHTSADDLSFITAEDLQKSLALYEEVLFSIESDRVFENLSPYCEPQLGRRGLYQTLGGRTDSREAEIALLWVLNQSDGLHSLLDIAERAGLALRQVVESARILQDHGLLKEINRRTQEGTVPTT